MKTNHLIALTTIALSLSACSFNKKTNDQKEVKTSVQNVEDQLNATATETDFNITFLPLSAPKQYQINFQWEKNIPYVKIEIQNVLTLNSEQNEKSLVASVRADQELKLIFTTYNSKKVQVSKFEKIVSTPKDFTFSEAKTFLNKDLILSEYRRVYINENVQVILNGKKLKITAEEVHFGNNSEIKTLDNSSAKTKDSELLDSAGIVEIVAEKLIGPARFEFFGYNGEDGLSSLDIARSLGVDLTSRAAQGATSLPGVAEDTCVTRSGVERCKPGVCKGSTNGFDGAPGFQAPTPQNGYRGGNSGSLILAVEQIEQKIIAKFKAGQPGNGGKGHTSQQGGKGGNVAPNTCNNNARPGNDGITPPPSIDAATGAEGLIMPVLINSTKFDSSKLQILTVPTK